MTRHRADSQLDGSYAAHALADGRPFTAIVEPDPAACDRLARAAAREMEGQGAAVTTVRNTTPWPMTVDKLIAQVGGEEGRDPARIIDDAVSSFYPDDGRAVLIVEQADTLDDEALGFLSDLSQALREHGGDFQILFAGREPLPSLLERFGFTGALAPAYEGALVTVPARAEAPPPRTSGIPRAGPAALLGALVIVAGFLLFARGSPKPDGAPATPEPATSATPPRAGEPAASPAAAWRPASPAPPAEPPADSTAADSSAALPQPAPSSNTPAPDVSPAAPPRAATAPPVAAPPAAPAGASGAVEARETALRHDFEAFLDESGPQTAHLTAAQKDALFKDYLVWRLRPDAQDAAARPPAAR